MQKEGCYDNMKAVMTIWRLLWQYEGCYDNRRLLCQYEGCYDNMKAVMTIEGCYENRRLLWASKFRENSYPRRNNNSNKKDTT